MAAREDSNSRQAYYEHIFTGKLGWGSHPPHFQFGSYFELISTKEDQFEILQAGVEI